jgi:hypothetical protein
VIDRRIRVNARRDTRTETAAVIRLDCAQPYAIQRLWSQQSRRYDQVDERRIRINVRRLDDNRVASSARHWLRVNGTRRNQYGRNAAAVAAKRILATVHAAVSNHRETIFYNVRVERHKIKVHGRRVHLRRVRRAAEIVRHETVFEHQVGEFIVNFVGRADVTV